MRATVAIQIKAIGAKPFLKLPVPRRFNDRQAPQEFAQYFRAFGDLFKRVHFITLLECLPRASRAA